MSRSLSEELDRLSEIVDNHDNKSEWTKNPNMYFRAIKIDAASEGSEGNHAYGGSMTFDLGDLYSDRESARELAAVLIKIKEKQYLKAKKELAALVKKYVGDE